MRVLFSQIDFPAWLHTFSHQCQWHSQSSWLLVAEVLLIMMSESPVLCWAALHRMFTIHISTARCLWWIRMSSPLCEGGTSPTVRGRVKSWVTSQQQSPGQHLHSDRLKKDKVPRCSTSCITSADPAAFCCCAADYAALISLPSSSELQSELLGCSS